MELAEVFDGDLRVAWEQAVSAVAGLQAAVGGAITDDDLLALQVNVEHLARRIGSLQVEIQSEIGRRSLHRRDGHASAKVMARHRLRLSDAEAARRQAAGRALRDLPAVRAAYACGAIGSDQVNLIASIHANPRVRQHLPGYEAELLGLARAGSHRELAAAARQWERLIDADGAFSVNERNHERRDARLVQDGIDLSWDLAGRFAAEQGARLRAVFDRYIEAEWQADWAEARARLGDAAVVADLARTDAQRRADALDRIFADAAGAPPGTRPPKVVHNIVWSAETYLDLLRQMAGQPSSGGEPQAWRDPATYRCHTIDGVPLEPVEAFASGLAGHVRRVIVNSRSVVVDLGTTARLFTGSARTAVQLQHTCCVWPGCEVPVSRCETDHLHPHARGGGTTPANGAPLCGFHNRWKQKGFVTARAPDGRWRIHRPDGSEVT